MLGAQTIHKIILTIVKWNSECWRNIKVFSTARQHITFCKLCQSNKLCGIYIQGNWQATLFFHLCILRTMSLLSVGVVGHGRLHSDWNHLTGMEDSCVVLLSLVAAGSSLLHTALKGWSPLNSKVYFQTIYNFRI